MPPQRVGRPVARSRASRNTRSVFRRPALTATASRRLATVASRRRGTFVVSPAHHARHEKGGRGAASGWVDAGKTSRAKTQSCLEPSGPRRAAIEARRAARPAKPWAVLACADTPGWSRRAFPQRLAGRAAKATRLRSVASASATDASWPATKLTRHDPNADFHFAQGPSRERTPRTF